MLSKCGDFDTRLKRALVALARGAVDGTGLARGGRS
jgi:hypothetical protein